MSAPSQPAVTDPSVPAKSFRFLDLPSEVRNNIYDLVADAGLRSKDPDELIYYHGCNVESLVAVCRQTHREYIGVIFRELRKATIYLEPRDSHESPWQRNFLFLAGAWHNFAPSAEQIRTRWWSSRHDYTL